MYCCRIFAGDHNKLNVNSLALENKEMIYLCHQQRRRSFFFRPAERGDWVSLSSLPTFYICFICMYDVNIIYIAAFVVCGGVSHNSFFMKNTVSGRLRAACVPFSELSTHLEHDDENNPWK